jgi:hypothetical protein
VPLLALPYVYPSPGFDFLWGVPTYILLIAANIAVILLDLPPVVLHYATVTRVDVGARGSFADDERVRPDRGERAKFG